MIFITSFMLLAFAGIILALPIKFGLHNLKRSNTYINSVTSTPFDIQIAPDVFLKSILSSRTNAQKKKELLKELQTLRMVSSTSTSSNQNEYVNFLDSLLREVDSIQNNKWAMFKFPIPIPSYRVKLGSLRRVLQTILAQENLPENTSNTVYQSTRRRSLSMVLNQLQYVRSIRSMEGEANRRLSTNTMQEMLSRTPEGLETPKYTVITASKNWEIRKYDDFAVCSTLMDPSEQGPVGFNALAGYIFGKNQPKEKMAMTTPVLSSTNNKVKKMSFVMPSKFWQSEDSLTSAPKPVDASVQLENKGGGLISSSNFIAVKWFGGYATGSVAERESSALLTALKDDDMWSVIDESVSPFLMQYNDPFQPPWKRRNEVAIPVKLKRQNQMQ
jgi:hypothetical protein